MKTEKRSQSFRVKYGCVGILAFLFLFAAPVFAAPSKQEVIAKYEKAVALAEQLDVYRQDVLGTVPKIREGAQALLREDYTSADKALNEALQDLELTRKNIPSRYAKQQRLDWLEVIYEIVQKAALIAILGLLFILIPFFNRRVPRSGPRNWSVSFYTAVFFGGVSVLFSIFDIFRYGNAWSFFDLPIVLTMAGGLFTGPWGGLLLGIWNGGLRFLLNAQAWIYLLIVPAAGLAAGFLGKGGQSLPSLPKRALAAGFLGGALHGMLLYYQTLPVLGPFYFAVTVLFLAVLESAALALLTAVIAAVAREQQARQAERDLISAKLLFLQAQIRPHFIFNALNAIASICSRENAVEARGLVQRLADFLREAIRRGETDVTVSEEMEYVKNYLAIEKVRFQDRLEIDYRLNLQNGGWQTRIPILTLQPIVENAVLHGSGKNPDGGKIVIEIQEHPESLEVSVRDNGPGFSEAAKAQILKGKAQTGGRESIGLRNIHERLERLYGSGRGLRIERPQDGGSRVWFEIPKKNSQKKER